MAELVVHQGMQIAAGGGDVGEAVRGHVALAEPPQIGGDDLEAGRGQRFDDPPPDAFGLGPAVHEQERHAADAFADVRLPKPSHLAPLRGEPLGVEVGRRRGAGHRNSLRHTRRRPDQSWSMAATFTSTRPGGQGLLAHHVVGDVAVVTPRPARPGHPDGAVGMDARGQRGHALGHLGCGATEAQDHVCWSATGDLGQSVGGIGDAPPAGRVLDGQALARLETQLAGLRCAGVPGVCHPPRLAIVATSTRRHGDPDTGWRPGRGDGIRERR